MASIVSANVIWKVLERVEDPEGLLWGDLDAAAPQLMKVFLECLAESELEMRLGARLYERSPSRTDVRNGTRTRAVQTKWCTVRVQIPRLRGQGFVPRFAEPGRRALPQVEDWVTKAYLCGLSRAEVVRLMETVTGCRPSEGVLKRVQAELDAACQVWRERPLEGKWQYLFLDAAWAKDIVGAKAGRVCILSAKGVDSAGQMQMLGFERAQRESESSWRGFLMRLKERGVSASSLKLVISDEHGGLLKAIQEVFGDVPAQLCWAHRMRNVRKAVTKADQKQVVEGLKAVYLAPHLVAAKRAFALWKAKWQESYPQVVATVEADLGGLLAFFHCSSEHWEYVRTSNPIERAFRELRRQQFGNGAFANRDACNRAVFRIFSWLNEKWKDKDIWDIRAAHKPKTSTIHEN